MTDKDSNAAGGDKRVKEPGKAEAASSHDSRAASAAKAAKKSEKPKHSGKFITFTLRAPGRIKKLAGGQKSKLHASQMASQQGGGSSSSNPPQESFEDFYRILAFGDDVHLFVHAVFGKIEPLKTRLLADTGSAITLLNVEEVSQHMRAHPNSDLLSNPLGWEVKAKFLNTDDLQGPLYQNNILLGNVATVQDQKFGVVKDIPKGGILGLGPMSQTRGRIVRPE